MTSDEAKVVIRLVSGYWPHPALTDDEAAVWGRALAPCEDVNLATQIIDSIARSGRDFRPTAGQFSAEYAARVPRSSGRAPESDGELEMTTEHKSTDDYRAEIRRKLAGAREPMRDGIGSITQGLEVDPRHPFPDSVHERGMAYAATADGGGAMTKLAFVDTETTGLDPDRHQIWEVGLIVREDGHEDVEHVWQFPVVELEADPFALNIGHYWERHWDADAIEISDIVAVYDAHKPSSRRKRFPNEGRAIRPSHMWARHFRDLTAGAHLVGAVVSFDEERLRKLLRRFGVLPRWHYHLVDVENLAAGNVSANAILSGAEGVERPDLREAARPPWDSEELSLALGIDPNEFERHSALGDARWARAIYDAVMTSRDIQYPAPQETEAP